MARKFVPVCVLSSYLDESIRLRQSIHNPSSVIKLNWKKKKKSDGTNEKVLLFYCVISAPARKIEAAPPELRKCFAQDEYIPGDSKLPGS